METSNNSILLENLDSGKVVCPKCNKGHMKPFNPKFVVNHIFICDNCGESITVTPNVIVD